jgi:hypothetical protein
LRVHHLVGTVVDPVVPLTDPGGTTTVTPAEIIYHRRVRLLALADELGNAAEACRLMGVSRTRFYEWRKLAGGEGSVVRVDPAELVGFDSVESCGRSSSCGSFWFIDAGSVSSIKMPISSRHFSQDEQYMTSRPSPVARRHEPRHRGRQDPAGSADPNGRTPPIPPSDETAP